MQFIFIVAGSVLAFLVVVGLIVSSMYKRSTKETSFVRTGFGGQKVIKDGGALILPVVHEFIEVNMNTIVLEVQKKNQQALITQDRMRVDVSAEFYLRVKPVADSIADAAQTLGQRTSNPNALRELMEGKFVDSLRAVAAEMTMTELHEQRSEFVQKVQKAVSEDISKNGLELETVSLTGFDQTSMEFFNPENDFDAEGLTQLTERLAMRDKERNKVQNEKDVEIAQQNLEAEQKQLGITKEQEFSRLGQEREVTLQQEQQKLELAQDANQKRQETEASRIETERSVSMNQQEAASHMATDKVIREQEVQMAKLNQEQLVKTETIEKQRELDAAGVQAALALESANIEKDKTLALNKQQQDIAVAEKSKELSDMETQATTARREQVLAQEQLTTAQQLEVADRSKREAIVVAEQNAEVQAVALRVGAEAEKQAAEDRAQAIQTRATGEANAVETRALADQTAAVAQAVGIEAIHEAENKLSPELIRMQLQMELIKNLPAIIEASTKPLENIEGIKILHVEGAGLLGGVSNGNGNGNGNGDLSMPDTLVNSALKFRAQAPLIDQLMGEMGLGKGTDFSQLTGDIMNTPKNLPVQE